MKAAFILFITGILFLGCKTNHDIKRVKLDRETIYESKLDSKTRLEVRIDEDGTARIRLFDEQSDEIVKFDLLYSPTSQYIDSFHCLQYDRTGMGLAGGVAVSSETGVVKKISIGEFRGTNFYLMLNKTGGLLPNVKRTWPIEGGDRLREQILYEFIPYPTQTTNLPGTIERK